MFVDIPGGSNGITTFAQLGVKTTFSLSQAQNYRDSEKEMTEEVLRFERLRLERKSEMKRNALETRSRK